MGIEFIGIVETETQFQVWRVAVMSEKENEGCAESDAKASVGADSFPMCEQSAKAVGKMKKAQEREGDPLTARRPGPAHAMRKALSGSYLVHLATDAKGSRPDAARAAYADCGMQIPKSLTASQAGWRLDQIAQKEFAEAAHLVTKTLEAKVPGGVVDAMATVMADSLTATKKLVMGKDKEGEGQNISERYLYEDVPDFSARLKGVATIQGWGKQAADLEIRREAVHCKSGAKRQGLAMRLTLPARPGERTPVVLEMAATSIGERDARPEISANVRPGDGGTAPA